MVIGTEPEGIAAGLVLGDVLQSGSKGLSGEIGHMIVAPDNTDVCVCGEIYPSPAPESSSPSRIREQDSYVYGAL
jgi:hypothetical protein